MSSAFVTARAGGLGTPSSVAVTLLPAELARPAWRGRMHAWAFVCSIPLGAVLVANSDQPGARTACAVYVVSLAAVFGTSAAYHRGSWSPHMRDVMRRLDHSMIYVLIAGTYTPMCIVALPPGWGMPLLIGAWAGAAAGVVLKVLGRLVVLSYALYLVLGWASLIAVPGLLPRVPATGLALGALGGVLYTVGAVILFRRRPDPSPLVFGFHEVWHACTVAAAALHYAMVWHVAA